MRREVIEFTLKTGVPNSEFEHLYIIEIIEAVYSKLSKDTCPSRIFMQP